MQDVNWVALTIFVLLFAFITFQQTMVRVAKRPAALTEGGMS